MFSKSWVHFQKPIHFWGTHVWLVGSSLHTSASIYLMAGTNQIIMGFASWPPYVQMQIQAESWKKHLFEWQAVISCEQKPKAGVNVRLLQVEPASPEVTESSPPECPAALWPGHSPGFRSPEAERTKSRSPRSWATVLTTELQNKNGDTATTTTTTTTNSDILTALAFSFPAKTIWWVQPRFSNNMGMAIASTSGK